MEVVSIHLPARAVRFNLNVAAPLLARAFLGVNRGRCTSSVRSGGVLQLVWTAPLLARAASSASFDVEAIDGGSYWRSHEVFSVASTVQDFL